MTATILEGDTLAAGDPRTVAISVAKAKLSELIDEMYTSGTPVVIRRRNKPAAVLVEVAEYEQLSELRDTVRNVQIRKALQGELYDLDEVIAGLGLGL